MANGTSRRQLASTEGMVDYDRNSYIQDQIVLGKSAVLEALVARIGAD